MPNPYLTIAEIAARFGVGERTVGGWIQDGHLKAVDVSRKLGSRKPRLRISDESLREFERLRSATASTSVAPRGRKRRSAEVVDLFP